MLTTHPCSVNDLSTKKSFLLQPVACHHPSQIAWVVIAVGHLLRPEPKPLAV